MVQEAMHKAGLAFPGRRRSVLDWIRIKLDMAVHGAWRCFWYLLPLDRDGDLPPERDLALRDWLTKPSGQGGLGFSHADWPPSSSYPPPLPGSYSEIRDSLGFDPQKGDLIWFDYRGHRHWGTIIDVDPQSGKIVYGDHSGIDGVSDDLVGDIGDHWFKDGVVGFHIIHVPDQVAGCRQPQYSFHNDSTFQKDEGGAAGSDQGRTTHGQICCWHENLANTWPWYSDSSAYACESWTSSDSFALVWDSMISPRMNFFGDSAVQFRQSTYSTLQHVSGTTIAVKGSTDNGATWPYVIGDDGLTEADLPWASNQRNVRIVWTFKGPPQTRPAHFWCVDDVEIWAKPTRNRDVSVSGVARPYGIVSQGQTMVPAAMVWNHGKQPETLDVTMDISPGYADTKTVMLYPYNDTLLEFTPWVAASGSYSATAFCGIDSDECRANDTASLSFRVADEEEDA
jgi:hypothetical protein